MERRRILTVATSFIFVLFAGCASVDQRVNLTYDVAGVAKGGSGELFIARPEETYNAVKETLRRNDYRLCERDGSERGNEE